MARVQPEHATQNKDAEDREEHEGRRASLQERLRSRNREREPGHNSDRGEQRVLTQSA